MEKQLKELAIRLYEIDAVKFGDFITKVGLKTPVYVDLRVLISYPKILKQISNILWGLTADVDNVNQICGVPYTALPIASIISAEWDIPMVIRRKEAKAYGTKKMIEGNFKHGDTCVIIEDVVTSGSSILETVRDLKNEGLQITQTLVILDRQQGGRKNIEKSGIKMQSLYTLTQLLEYLLEANKITSETLKEVTHYLAQHSAPVKTLEDGSSRRLKLDFTERSKIATSPLASKLLKLMDQKGTTLCLAADLTSANEILELSELAGPHIAVLKIHVDIIEDFDLSFIQKLKQLSSKHKFYLMEDRKFGDIGNTASLQYEKGIYKIAEWADFITAHPVPGPSILDGLKYALRNVSDDRGIFLVTQMSSNGALTTETYVKASVTLSQDSNLVVGHVCQSNIFSDPGLIQLTPGVKLTQTSDNLGQQYNTPEVVVNAGADLVVVGRGITESPDKLSSILNYKNQLWAAYKNRISS
ncbi:uridine 5'-monophosphate synthase [Fopius arisanus]|uniref:Uridine 5'-monophosphate synthase n=2 Tax=Fopius arisanus TaxID=64838 RepID=A0A0C9QBM4_9HYME|nr:PREDICTED: uridine 5'-monophosphate synthase [Fopius arisanus]